MSQTGHPKPPWTFVDQENCLAMIFESTRLLSEMAQRCGLELSISIVPLPMRSGSAQSSAPDLSNLRAAV
jgi:hypothetical protein